MHSLPHRTRHLAVRSRRKMSQMQPSHLYRQHTPKSYQKLPRHHHPLSRLIRQVYYSPLDGRELTNVGGQHNTVSATHQESSRPVPPAALEAPEVAERGATPAIKAADKSRLPQGWHLPFLRSRAPWVRSTVAAPSG